MNINIKKLHPDSIIPQYSKEGDAGMDLTAVSVNYNKETNTIDYNTGIAIEIPKGYVGLLFPRSSISKKNLILCNSVGVIDSGYRGEIIFKFKTVIEYIDIVNSENFQNQLEKGLFDIYLSNENYFYDQKTSVNIYKLHDRIGQIIILPYPQVKFNEVSELSSTERGEGGFGSTGN